MSKYTKDDEEKDNMYIVEIKYEYRILYETNKKHTDIRIVYAKNIDGVHEKIKNHPDYDNRLDGVGGTIIITNVVINEPIR